MALEQLAAKTVENQRKPCMLCDGGGLYFRIRQLNASKEWFHRFTSPTRGKRRDLPLGHYPDMSLAEARLACAAARKLRDQGVDPIDERERRKAAASNARFATFKDCADQYIRDIEGTVDAKTQHRKLRALIVYVYPPIGARPIKQIETLEILDFIKPQWKAGRAKPAKKILEIISSVFQWAMGHGLRKDNPADWTVLKHALTQSKMLLRKEHHPALPYRDVPAFYEKIKGDADVHIGTKPRNHAAGLCLRFIILTAVRVEDAVNAKWDQFDLGAGEWAIPSRNTDKMRGHLIPLPDAVIDLLKEALQYKLTDYVFLGDYGPISKATVLNVAKRTLDPTYRSGRQKNPFVTQGKKCGEVPITTHGFRASFMTWAAEQTNFPLEVREHALAHKVGTTTQQSYQRGTLYDKRKVLMQAWADYVTGKTATETGKVIPLRKA